MSIIEAQYPKYKKQKKEKELLEMINKATEPLSEAISSALQEKEEGQSWVNFQDMISWDGDDTYSLWDIKYLFNQLVEA